MSPVQQGLLISDDLRDEVHRLFKEGDVPGRNQDKVFRETLRQVYRALAKSSLYFLTKAILGYSDLTYKTHRSYCDFLQDLRNRKTLDLMPRGVFKTTCGTIGFSIWYLLNHPNHSILIANQKEGNAEIMLEEIESHLDGGDRMMAWLFPEHMRPHDKFKFWSSQKMTFPGRTVTSGKPSIMVIGVGGRAESLHFHVIINDDLIGKAAQQSESLMIEAISWHDYSVSLFVRAATGIERAHGTRYLLNDLYSVMIDDPEYTIYYRQAEDPNTGELLFPEWLTREELRRIKERNFAHYMAQYQNNPRDPSALDFRAEWLRRYLLLKEDTTREPYCEIDGEKFFVKDMQVVMAVDPAGSGDADINLARMAAKGRARKSNNAVGVVGLHGSGRYFLLDLWVGRGKGRNPELEVAEHMLEMVVAWHDYMAVGYVESYGAQRALITIFDMLARQNDVYFRMEEAPRGIQKAKNVRIRTMLGPAAENGMLAVRPSHDQFINEFGDFPQGILFDTLDMMYWAMFHLKKPRSKVEEIRMQKSKLRKKLNRMRSVSRAGY